MIEYLLVIQLCNNIDGDCTWSRAGRFASEEVCVSHGLANNPFTIRFKCVQLEKRLGPDQQIPLPRARPKQ